MKFPYISRNGVIIPAVEAVVPVDETEVTYGFGVYETIKLRNNILYFLPQHIDRLLHSAKQIGLSHTYTADRVEQAIVAIVRKVEEQSCNIKIVLYGGKTPEMSQLFIIPSAPLYPDRKWYRDGVSLISFEHERWMPQAKTLNMLPSYVMYKKAKEQNCYDALLYDKQGNMLEGTRTNVFLIKGTNIISPPKSNVLEGVTMMTLEKVIQHTEYRIEYTDVPMSKIWEYDGMFISSTSTKIMPVKQIDGKAYLAISKELLALIELYDHALDASGGDFNTL